MNGFSFATGSFLFALLVPSSALASKWTRDWNGLAMDRTSLITSIDAICDRQARGALTNVDAGNLKRIWEDYKNHSLREEGFCSELQNAQMVQAEEKTRLLGRCQESAANRRKEACQAKAK